VKRFLDPKEIARISEALADSRLPMRWFGFAHRRPEGRSPESALGLLKARWGQFDLDRKSRVVASDFGKGIG
jgi:hypothetical protein